MQACEVWKEGGRKFFEKMGRVGIEAGSCCDARQGLDKAFETLPEIDKLMGERDRVRECAGSGV